MQPITPVKAFPKFECNIYSDIDFQSAISVSSTGNSRSLTEQTDRLAFVNFSTPAYDHVNGVKVIEAYQLQHVSMTYVCKFGETPSVQRIFYTQVYDLDNGVKVTNIH